MPDNKELREALVDLADTAAIYGSDHNRTEAWMKNAMNVLESYTQQQVKAACIEELEALRGISDWDIAELAEERINELKKEGE